MQLRSVTETSLEINEELEGAEVSYLTVFQDKFTVFTNRSGVDSNHCM